MAVITTACTRAMLQRFARQAGLHSTSLEAQVMHSRRNRNPPLQKTLHCKAREPFASTPPEAKSHKIFTHPPQPTTSTGGTSPLMGPLGLFFSQYNWFSYDPLEPAAAQFRRLCKQGKWKRGSNKRDKAWEAYRTALVRQFNSSFAKDDDVLSAWHALLRHIGIADPPASVQACKELISGKFINLVDLIDARRDSSVVITHFPSESALSEYTLDNGKLFPRDHVEAGNLLKFLLRHIRNPNPKHVDPSQRVSRGQGKKKRRG